MIKEWVTVMSWHNGILTVHCKTKSLCKNCISHASCNYYVLNMLRLQNDRILYIPSEQPLKQGQKIELGITKSSLLGSAILIYFSPLIGLFILAWIFQTIFNTDFATICATPLGFLSGFLFARNLSLKFVNRVTRQPIILNIKHSSKS